MDSTILGIDISKKTFDVALLIHNKTRTKKFDNCYNGFTALKQWLEHVDIDNTHACMEATGCYGEKLAQYLYNNNFKVSIVNPARIKGFSLSKLSRVKTDKTDCILIAEFCLAMKPKLWKPASSNIVELKQLVSRLDALIAMRLQEGNRLEKIESKIVTNIQAHIDFLDIQIKEIEQLIAKHIKQDDELRNKSNLLRSIPGIGTKTISVVLSLLGDTENFESAKQIAAFVGLNPKVRQSGSSVRGAGRISKTGDSNLRKAFYMPAITATKHNPIIKSFADRLAKAGKPKMVIVVAAMRKLLHIIYGVLKTKVPFNPNLTAI